MTNSDGISWDKIWGGTILMGIGLAVIAVLASGWISVFPDSPPVRLWLAGAGALGLVSGFITGLSKADGSGPAFMTFLGTGLVVPLLGGVAALLGQTEEVTETSTYLNSQLAEKTTKTVTSVSDGSLHPISVLGSFFLVFSVLAIVGVVGGALLKKGGLPEILAN